MASDGCSVARSNEREVGRTFRPLPMEAAAERQGPDVQKRHATPARTGQAPRTPS